MRKLFFTAIGIGTLLTAQAQNDKGGIIIKGGINFANISTTDNGRVDDAKMLPSFHAGVLADLRFTQFFSFQPGLLITGKGSKTEIYLNNNNTSSNYLKLKTNPLYLEVPANFVFHIGNKDAGFFIGAGPYVAMGIGGKTKGERNVFGVNSSYEQNIDFNDDDPFTEGQEDASVNKLRRFDYGLNALAGFESDKFLVGVNYGYGLAKIGSNQANDDDKNKHRVLSLSVGFKL